MSIYLQGQLKNSTLRDPQSSNPTMGTYYIANNPERYEPQRSNNFEFVVDFSNTDLYLPGTNTPLNDSQKILRVSVTSAPVPHFSQTPITIDRGNNQAKFAGKPTFGNGPLVVNDYIGDSAKEILVAWQALSYNVMTEKVGLASDYKKKATLIEYTPDLQVVRSWNMYGCWISGISEDAYNSDQNSKKQTTATIEYDYAMIDTSSIQ